MSRRTLPLLIISAALLLVILVLLIALRFAGARRGDAVRDLLSGSGELAEAAESVAAPTSPGGSLDNLRHFFSKDPGRRRFARAADRRRAAAYLEGTEDTVQEYMNRLPQGDHPEWAALFAGRTRTLFSRVRNDILVITGIPQELTSFARPPDSGESSVDRVRSAVGRFAAAWIPPRRASAFYTPDRREIRDYLLKNRRFERRMEALDKAWLALEAALYNLSIDSRWLLAVSFDPALDTELAELTTLTAAADIYRMRSDIMTEVPDDTPSPGIRWTSNFSYYKNIPEISGQTADIEPAIFFAKVNLGYTFRDSLTQTWLNRRKDWLTDYFLTFFSNTVTEDFSPITQPNPEKADWQTARLKAQAIYPINKKMVLDTPFGRKKAFGIRELALIRVNLIANP